MSSGPFRLQPGQCSGSALDRARRVAFCFDDRSYEGFAGDTLASALLAAGVRTFARSFKFHRPRGVYSSGVEEPNAFVQLGAGARTVPAARATQVELREGLQAYSHARRRFDVLRLLDFTAPLWAAGFYNKTFIWPGWHAYEWLVRRMAGFGHAPPDPDPDRYDWRNRHCDTLVVGGGPAGLLAARDAARDGARVLLVEQSSHLGGRSAWDGSSMQGESAEHALRAMANIEILTRTSAIGYYERDVVTLIESVPADAAHPLQPRERYWVVRARRVVLATGAIEQPLVFCNNDRPGILLAGAAHEYLRRYAVACGRRVLVATNNDSAYALARDLQQCGVEVLAVADSRSEVPQALRQQLDALSIPLLEGTLPIDTHGFSALRGVTLGRLSADARAITEVRRYACDALAISGGWNPTLHLYSQATGTLRYDAQSGALALSQSHPVASFASGESITQSAPGPRVSPVGNTARQWIDLRHDVTVADLELGHRESYASVEHAKRYTTTGMAADQGKTSNLVALEVMSRLRGVDPAEVGHTTFRPPFVPVTLGAIAGRATGSRFAPARLLPLHDWHMAHGALMQDFGEWKRPAAYLRDGESRDEAVTREARAVRTAAGLLDYSPLGKIEVHGPDALEFLNRFYINELTTLKPHRARYGLLLRESGVIFDDGTVVMLEPDRFLITTTSGNARRVAAWFEEWHQCEWPHLRVTIAPVTESWACLSLAGPRSRDILASVAPELDLSSARLPHLSMCETRLVGADARLYRVSFTGELTYEINIRASAAQRLWDALLDAGAPHGLQPFGLDALLLMRLEKGYLHVGTDTDGTTVPDDVGWGKVAANKRTDYVGRRSLSLPENRRADRLQLVGLRSTRSMIVGSHLRIESSSEPTDGWVTSAGRAPLTGEPIALALLRGGRERAGARLNVHDGDTTTEATVVDPTFYDPAGERMNV
ncbi:MAG TPA: 2Fe-2S iron-sulfur cluster-binding protein [Steroidobacteraceae bacterium]|nr:2Fe-2S iron-sulfur cluster-binding protein [Steroidobacteraceae bacterium]